MEICKYCGSSALEGHGTKRGSRKWKCKNCNRTQCEVDRRFKFTDEEKKMAINIYLEGVGLRGTARILSQFFKKSFCAKTVMTWVAKAGIKIEEELEEREREEYEQKEGQTFKKTQKDSTINKAKKL